MNFSTETSHDTQLILDELRKLSAMQSELFADLAVCISCVAAPSAAAISRVAAPSTAAVSPVPVPLIVADNWGGLFDGGDDPDEQQPKAPIVVDSWGGIFEQPTHILDERESIEQIRVKSCLASTDSDVIFTELASTDQICVEGAYTFPNLDAPACLTPASIVSAAATSVPVDISPAKCAQFEEKLQVTNIADLEEALPKRETGMRALAVAGPLRLDVSLIAPAPEAVSDSELYGTAKAPTLLASSIAALDCSTASLAQRLPRSANSIHHEYGLTPSFPNRIRNPCAKDDDDPDNPGVEVAGLFRKLSLNGAEDITTVLGGYDSSLDDDPATCFVHFDAPLDRAVGRVGQALAGVAVFYADAVGAAGGGLLARVVDARSAQSTCSTVCLAGDCNFADVLVGVLWKEEMLRWNYNMCLCDAHDCCGSVGLILDPDPCRHSHYLVAHLHQHDLVLHGDRLLCYTTTLVVAAALSKCGAHSVHAEIVFDKMWIKSDEKLVCAIAETASVRALKDVDDSSSGVERLILELLLLIAVPMKPVSRDGAVCREFVHLLLPVCSYMLHQSCIVTWLRRSTLSCYIEFQPWALPVQFEQSEGVQFRCVLSDFAVPWKYMIIAVRFIVIPSVVGMSLLGSVVVDTLMLSYMIIGLISPLKPVSPGGFELLVFRQEAFNLLTLYVPNMYCMVGHYWVLSDASIHASLIELCVNLRSVWSGLVDAQYTVIARQAVAILLWPPLDELRLTSCDAELQPTPWSSFTMAELFSVRSYYGQLGKPPWPIQICQHISLLLLQLKRHVPVSEIIPMSTTTGSDQLKCGGHFVPISVTRIDIRFWSKQGNSDTEACLDRNDPNHDSRGEPVDLVDVTVSTTLEDYKQYAILLFERYFSNGDVKLSASDLNKLGYNDFLQNSVKKLVYTATDRHDKEEEIEPVLLSYPYGNVISSTHITVEEVKKRIADLLQEYIRNGDTTEACRCISEWAVHPFHQKLVNQAFILEMESPAAKAPIVILLPALQKHKIVRFSWDPGGSQLLLSVSMAGSALTQEQVQRKCGGNCEDDSIVYDIKNLQVPWDPGGFELLHRLEGKSKLKKGGMLGTSSGWADP